MVAEQYPAMASSGIRCKELRQRGAVARWSYEPSTLRPGGLISGPTMFIVSDAAFWFATFTVLGPAPMAVTSDLHITFLRPAMGGDLLADCQLLRVGRTRLYGEVRVWVEGDEERPVAHAVGNYAPPRAP